MLPEPVASLERVSRSGHTFRRQLRREHARPVRGGCRAALPHRQLADASDPERHARRDRDGDGVAQRGAIEPENLAGAAGGADGGEHPLVPALQRDRVREAAERFVRGGDGRDDGAAVRAAAVGHRQHRGNHVARVARPPRGVGVVAIQIADQHGVRERGEVRGRPLRRAENARRRGALDPRREAHGDGGRLAVERPGRAAERVDEGPLHLVNRLRGKIGVAQPVRVVAQVRGRGVHESLLSHG